MTESAHPGASADLSATAIAAWLREQIAHLLEVPVSDVPADAPFESYGMGSSDAVFLTGDLSELMGMQLSATLAWDFPTIDALATFLAAVAAGEAELPSDAIEWDLDADLESPT